MERGIFTIPLRLVVSVTPIPNQGWGATCFDNSLGGKPKEGWESEPVCACQCHCPDAHHEWSSGFLIWPRAFLKKNWQCHFG